MSDCVITGTITSPIANSGPTASLYIGSPTTYYGSVNLTREYEESKTATLKLLLSDGETTISLDSVAAGDVVYLGCDLACTFKIDGNAHVIGDASGTATDGGFIMISGGSVAALTVTASLEVETTVTVAVYGE